MNGVVVPASLQLLVTAEVARELASTFDERRGLAGPDSQQVTGHSNEGSHEQ
jgi:hypothetical protein